MDHQPVAVDKLKAGLIVAKPLLSESGKVLLDKGAILTADIIQYLQSWRISQVYVLNMGKVRTNQIDLLKLYEETLQAISLIFEKVRMFQEVPADDCKQLVSSYIEIMVDAIGVVENLYSIKGHSEYTYRHSLNVSIISGLIGKWMGLQQAEIRELILAGLLHDIGKTIISKKILDKPGKLTNEEMEIMRTHSQQGYRLIAKSADISSAVKTAVLQHHERGDGSGYPLGLMYNEISTVGRIIAIADIYDAMTSERVYKRMEPPFAVVETILGQMYGKLDPQICLTFISNLSQRLVGTIVQLSNGQIAKVVLFNNTLSARPVVQLESGVCLDLEKRRDITIVAVLSEDNEVMAR